MAHNKTGFDYFNVDTDRFQDIRIKRLKKNQGCIGFAVYEYILNEIYRIRGCFLAWDDSTAFDVADYWGLKESQVTEVVNYCCSVGLFDEELLSSGRVLTSRSIQSRYLEMCSRARRKDVIIPEKYRIITEESHIIPEQSKIIQEVCDNSKVKYSKVKKKENKEKSSRFTPPSLSDVQDYFSELIEKKGLRISKITESQKFVDFYASKNWYVGKNKMTDWKAAVRNWINRIDPPTQSNNHRPALFPELQKS